MSHIYPLNGDWIWLQVLRTSRLYVTYLSTKWWLDLITGVKNITALGNLISWQKVEYDFRFHRQDFLSNVSVLILSEAKSILPVSVNVSTVRG